MRGQIHVQVIRSDLGPLCSKATCISIGCGDAKYQTQSVRGHETVEWNEQTRFLSADDNEALVFKVKTKKLLGFETVGSVSVPVGELPRLGQEPIQKTVVVDDKGSSKRRVSITYRCWVSNAAAQSPSETSLQRSKSSPASPRRPESISSIFRRHSDRTPSSTKKRSVAATYKPSSLPVPQKHKSPVPAKSPNWKSRSSPRFGSPIPEIVITPPEMVESFSLDPSKTATYDIFQYDSDFSEESLDYNRPQDAYGLSSAEHILEPETSQSEEVIGAEVMFGSTFSPSLDSISEEVPEMPVVSSDIKSVMSEGDDLRLECGSEGRQRRLQLAIAATLAYCSDRNEQRQRLLLAKAAESDPQLPLGSLSAPLTNPPVPKLPTTSQSGPLPVSAPSFSLPFISFSNNENLPTMVPPESPPTGLADAFSGISFFRGGFLRKNDSKPVPPRRPMSDLYRRSDLLTERENLDLDFDGPDVNWNPPNTENGRDVLGIPSV